MTKKISKKQLRDFGLLIGFGFPLIIGWLIPSITGHAFREWTAWISIPTLVLAIISPKILQKPYQAWMQLGQLLGYVNSRIILGLVFIIVLLPIAFAMRIFGYDPLRKKRKGETTYRENREDLKIDLTRIF
tara:strand:- start:17 stop:409 length:393 start_codon:yes stop_codon:yes gene_type:complete